MFKRSGTQDEPEREQLPRGASALIGGSGVSLDGKSLILPDAGGDDVSSINTNQYEYNGGMRILGTLDHDEEVPGSFPPPVNEVMNKSAQAQANANYEYKTSYDDHNSPEKKKDEKSQGSDGSAEGGCLPQWITDAPTWLKLVIVMSTALLVGAIVLIGVGAALAVEKESPVNQGSGSVSQPIQPFANPTQPPAIVITAPPVASDPGGTPSEPTPTAPTPADPPAGEPTTPTAPSAPTAPADSPTDPPQAGPTDPPVAAPTDSPTPSPSPSPIVTRTASPTSTVVNFFVMGGRFTAESLAALPDQLTTLPNIDGNTVLYHLGDWNSPYATSCVESSYTINVELYKNSAVPVYFVPGDNEFNDCPNPDQAFGFWYEYILGFESRHWPAPTAWNVSRQEPDYAENFAFVQNGLLIVSVNLVGGVVHDDKEWEARHEADLEWIDDQFYRFQGQFSAMVVLAHADPEIQANQGFFTTFYQRVETDYAAVQVIYFHRNLGVEPWELQANFNGIPNLMVVVVEGSVWPPMLVNIDTAAGIVQIDQDQWYMDYLQNGSV